MRLIIVEDDSLLRENLGILLGGEKDISVAGLFGSAEAALGELADLSPDIMLVDLGLPGMPGVDLIQKAKEIMPRIEILAHTVYEDRQTVFAAIKAGASGYILKGSSPRELVESIHNLHHGGSPMSPRIARRVIQEFQSGAAEDLYLLSPREKEILREIESGLTYKEVAGKYSISAHTVHAHIKNIYEKLQAKSRREALISARKKGIL
ncbi:MAG: response regulator transcription factor [Nitrospiraceae bacterium]|nr:response regulator transcription factor [Nitrospiraceae bacterium]